MRGIEFEHDRGNAGEGAECRHQQDQKPAVVLQHRVARETGCAFLDLFAAMGGAGTMARWHEGKKHLVGGDLTHPTAEGAETVGGILYKALVEGYTNYRAQLSNERGERVIQAGR